MANNSDGFKIWIQVQDEARFELSVVGKGTPPEQTFVASARVHVDTGDEETWIDQSLRPGPQKKILSVPRLYIVRVHIAFTGSTQATAIIRAKIVNPDLTTHDVPFEYEVSGVNGEVKSARISIVTQNP